MYVLRNWQIVFAIFCIVYSQLLADIGQHNTDLELIRLFSSKRTLLEMCVEGVFVRQCIWMLHAGIWSIGFKDYILTLTHTWRYMRFRWFRPWVIEETTRNTCSERWASQLSWYVFGWIRSIRLRSINLRLL